MSFRLFFFRNVTIITIIKNMIASIKKNLNLLTIKTFAQTTFEQTEVVKTVNLYYFPCIFRHIFGWFAEQVATTFKWHGHRKRNLWKQLFWDAMKFFEICEDLYSYHCLSIQSIRKILEKNGAFMRGIFRKMALHLQTGALCITAASGSYSKEQNPACHLCGMAWGKSWLKQFTLITR